MQKVSFSGHFDPKIHLVAIQEIAVSSTAMTHTYWSAPISKKVMALYYDLPVFKDVYQMTLRIFQGLSLTRAGNRNINERLVCTSREFF